MEKTFQRPASPTSMYINTLGLFSGVACLLVINLYAIPLNGIQAGIACMLAYALPIIVLESIFLHSFRNRSTGIVYRKVTNPFNGKRILTKLLGLYASFALIALVYWLFPEYHQSFYSTYYELLAIFIPPLLILSIPYFIFVDRHMAEPEDAYWSFGRALLGDRSQLRFDTTGQHLLGWSVKTFFFPLMFLFLLQNINNLVSVDLATVANSFSSFYRFFFDMLLFTDLMIAAVGYVCTLRILDAHIRTTEPTFLGWAVTLACYQPYWSFVSSNYLSYGSGQEWNNWFSGYPLFSIAWGTVILVLLLIYVFSSVPFGIRFSNLTHRGIFTNGPYRFTRHPAYVSKNISWWMISLPFLSSAGIDEAIRHSLLLLMVNAIYFFRARTEERHLSWDPVYVQYAEYIDEKGMFRWLNRVLPILRFKRYQMFNLGDK